MSRTIRLSLIFILLLAVVPAVPAGAEGIPPLPASCNQTPLPGENGDLYFICMPPDGIPWNGNLVVFAHGYVDPYQPQVAFMGQLLLPDGSWLMELPMQLGYAFAATSYSKNGLAIKEGVQDVIGLVDYFKKSNHNPDMKVLLTGASEGGLVTALALEQHPDVFAGGLATCGPIGDFQRQLNYFGDFRVVFDYFFPGVLQFSPVEIPPEAIAGWNTVLQPAVLAAISTNKLATAQLFSVTRASIDPLDLLPSIGKTTTGILWYNIFATNDAWTELGGVAFDNMNRKYFGSLNDAKLNAKVERIPADPEATQEINEFYQTSGKLTVPLIAMHNVLDPVVPYWHEPLYRLKTFATRSMSKYTNIPILSYGHCNFTKEQVMAAFGYLVYKTTGKIPPLVNMQAITPEEVNQIIFLPQIQEQ